MVPAGEITESTVHEVADALEKGDAIIDGGNSYYLDDIRRSEEFAEKGIDYIDCGTSGGVLGLDRGYCLMIGGPDKAVKRLDPIFASVAPGIGDIDRTPGRKGDPVPVRAGLLHCGPSGAGHFVKMVHNGIEYGLMAAYAEGLNIIRNADAGKVEARGRRRDRAARAPRALPVRDRHLRGRRGLAPRQRRRLLAARPGGRGAARVADPGRVRRPGLATPARAAGPRSRRSRRACRRRC